MEAIDESFEVSDTNTDAKTVDALNTSFKSIKEMIEDFVPYVTPQEYATISLQIFPVVDNEYGPFVRPNQQVNVFGSAGNSFFLIGVLQPNGYFKVTNQVNAYVTINQIYRSAL